MARRADHTPEELRNLALRKGLEIIDESGTSGLTARGLAQAIGYTPGTLYHVFGSLEGYLLALGSHILDLWHVELAQAIAASRKSAIQTLAAAYITFAVTHKNRWELAFAHAFTPHTPVPKEYIANMERLLHLIDNALLEHEPTSDKRRKLAKTLWASMHGICALAHMNRLSYSAGDTPQTLAQVLLDLIEPKKK